MAGPLIDAERLLAADPALTVVDCRFVLGDVDAGAALYATGHIPGASFLDVDRDLAAAPGDTGRHPLPDGEAFAASARAAGISDGVPVVAYDAHGEGGAVRCWWLLRHFGHTDVSVLDGGMETWVASGGELVEGAEPVAAGDFSPRTRAGDLVAREDVANAAARGELVDARAAERYLGEVEPVDPVAGHVPGARSLPFAGLAPDGRFLPVAQLGAQLGEGPLVAYCGSGVTACTVVLAGELAGVDVRLYPGGWSEWSRRGLPAERG